MKVLIRRKDDAFYFEAESETGAVVKMDASPEVGGSNKGARPMELLLMGLAGCSGIDVAIVLKKKRVRISAFEMTVEGKRKAGIPSPFESIHIHYKIWGNVTEEGLKRAVDMSMDKYCSATAQLRASSAITYSIEVIPEEISNS